MARSKRTDGGLLGTIALVALVGKALGGILKVAAMGGAVLLGWTVGRKAIDRFTGDARSPDFSRAEIATDVASP